MIRHPCGGMAAAPAHPPQAVTPRRLASAGQPGATHRDHALEILEPGRYLQPGGADAEASAALE